MASVWDFLYWLAERSKCSKFIATPVTKVLSSAMWWCVVSEKCVDFTEDFTASITGVCWCRELIQFTRLNDVTSQQKSVVLFVSLRPFNLIQLTRKAIPEQTIFADKLRGAKLPFSPNLDSRCNWMEILTPLSFYPRKRGPRCPLKKGWLSPEPVWTFRRKTEYVAHAGIRTAYRPSRSVVSIRPELHQLVTCKLSDMFRSLSLF